MKDVDSRVVDELRARIAELESSVEDWREIAENERKALGIAVPRIKELEAQLASCKEQVKLRSKSYGNSQKKGKQQ